MELSIQGKQMDVGDALRAHIRDKIEAMNGKYFNKAIGGTVTMTPEAHAFYKTHIILQVGHFTIVGAAVENEPYLSFDTAAEKVAKQLRRYKRRLRDHQERTDTSPEAELRKARDYVLATSENADDEDQPAEAANSNDPVIIAEMTTHMPTLSVHDAVMRLDLSGENAMLFHNAKHGRINMVYRRNDGNIGWVDPDENGK